MAKVELNKNFNENWTHRIQVSLGVGTLEMAGALQITLQVATTRLGQSESKDETQSNNKTTEFKNDL